MVFAASPAPQVRAQQVQQTSVESRLGKIERLLSSGTLMDMTMKLETLQREVSELRGKVEELGFKQNQVTEQQRSIYVDLDGRLQGLESELRKLSSGPSIKQPAQSGGDASFDPEQARHNYTQAFNLIKARRYDDAMGSLEQFVQHYPKSDLAGNAQYWLGELNFVKGDYKKAVGEFDKVLTQHASSKKAADAMLKKGFSFYELGEWEEARNSLTELTKKYPKSTPAHLAQKRLQKMKREGH